MEVMKIVKNMEFRYIIQKQDKSYHKQTGFMEKNHSNLKRQTYLYFNHALFV